MHYSIKSRNRVTCARNHTGQGSFATRFKDNLTWRGITSYGDRLHDVDQEVTVASNTANSGTEEMREKDERAAYCRRKF